MTRRWRASAPWCKPSDSQPAGCAWRRLTDGRWRSSTMSCRPRRREELSLLPTCSLSTGEPGAVPPSARAHPSSALRSSRQPPTSAYRRPARRPYGASDARLCACTRRMRVRAGSDCGIRAGVERSRLRDPAACDHRCDIAGVKSSEKVRGWQQARPSRAISALWSRPMIAPIWLLGACYNTTRG
jgi:hypothetical protein